MKASERFNMKGIVGFILAGGLAVLAALVVVWGEPGSAELHLVNAVTADTGSAKGGSWLSFFVGP
ncbi:hypothetical protein [uncultured Pseudacidovorax sp.]|nr:hypothetical protein [uncultured Pseudacidovorax sp.]